MVVDELFLNGDGDLFFHLAAHLLGDDGCGVEVDELAQGGHDAVFHQALDHLGAGLLHAAGQFAHADLVGNHDLHGSLLGNLQLQAAHLLLLVLAALVGHGHAPALAVGADLLLAAPLLALHPVGPLAAQSLQTLIVLGKVHVAALAGIHDLLLRHPGGGVRHHRLGLGLLGILLLRSRLLLRGLLGRLLRGGLLGSCRLLRRSRGGLLGLLLIGVGKDHLDAGDLIVLGQIIEDHGQLMVRQHLHVVLGGRHILGEDLRNGLGGQAEVLGHLMHSVFLNTQSKHLVTLQPEGWGIFSSICRRNLSIRISALPFAEGALALFHRAAVGIGGGSP